MSSSLPPNFLYRELFPAHFVVEMVLLLPRSWGLPLVVVSSWLWYDMVGGECIYLQSSFSVRFFTIYYREKYEKITMGIYGEN